MLIDAVERAKRDVRKIKDRYTDRGSNHAKLPNTQ